MKKGIPLLLVVAVLLGGAFWWFSKKPGMSLGRSSIEEARLLAPANAVLYFQIGDATEIVSRLEQTGFAAIGREPQIAALLDNVKAAFPNENAQLEEANRVRTAIQAQGAFLSLSADANGKIQILGGFRPGCTREILQKELEPLILKMRESSSDGVAGSTTVGAYQVDTFTSGENVLAAGLHDGWYLIGNAPDALGEAWSRLKAGDASKSFESASGWATAKKSVPATADTMVFFDGTLAESVDWETSGFNAANVIAGLLERFSLFCATTRIVDGEFEDTMWWMPIEPVAQATQSTDNAAKFDAFCPPQAMWFSRGAFTLPEFNESEPPSIPDNAAFSAMPEAAALFGQIQRIFSSPEAYGNLRAGLDGGFAVVADWPKSRMQPTGSLIFGLKDRERIVAALDAVSTPDWTKSTLGENVVYSTGTRSLLVKSSFTLLLTPKFLLAGSDSPEQLLKTLTPAAKPDAPSPAHAFLAQSQKADWALWFDLPNAFGRTYSMLRPMIPMLGMFGVTIPPGVDLSNLPDTNTLTAHLKPVTFTVEPINGGTRLESRGSMTITQILVLQGTVGVWMTFNPQ